MSNSFDPDQAGHFVGPDLGPKCLQKLSADDTRKPILTLSNWARSLIFGLSLHLHPYYGWCSDISATDISAMDVSAWTFRPRTFRPQKKPKVDVSAITINFGFGMCACINV